MNISSKSFYNHLMDEIVKLLISNQINHQREGRYKLFRLCTVLLSNFKLNEVQSEKLQSQIES